jgi:hypothetical protein
VLHFLERDADIAAEQLVLVPLRTRIGPDHGGGQQRVDDSCSH